MFKVIYIIKHLQIFARMSFWGIIAATYILSKFTNRLCLAAKLLRKSALMNFASTCQHGPSFPPMSLQKNMYCTVTISLPCFFREVHGCLTLWSERTRPISIEHDLRTTVDPNVFSGWWFQPLWKMLYSQVGLWFPIYGKNKICSKPPPSLPFQHLFLAPWINRWEQERIHWL